MPNSGLGYTDEEIRLSLLPHVISLVNQEAYRARNECNTVVMAGVVSELLNIVKYGTVKAPESEPATAAEPQIVNAEPVVEAKFA